ncbi:PREDICTED: ankyrin repeat domain-containing protein 53 [Nanorana parkeri]|uniref:ankyrin repeat domain-containing protein 53 n=1 Tax=Nanorana parkeri TaxID=125878 RepID=UPI000854A7CA|nr:PREDICTED: ankyrin repeat domain-containing protein 53 [Nanorana parkeri]
MAPQPLGPQKGTLDKADVTSDQLTAASVGNVDWLRLCMQAAGSHIEQDGNGFTALHMAALHGRLRCLKVLIEDYKMDVNLPSRCGWRALHLVLSQKNRKKAKECLQLLLRCGADVNVESESMVTPLHQAAREGLEDCLAILVENGADVHAKDLQGNRPIDLCKIWCHRNCARYLHNATWKKDKEEFARELKKMETLKRNILEMDREALLKMMKTHETCFCVGTETKKPPEKARGTSIKTKVSSDSKVSQMSSKLLPGKEQHKKKLSASEGLDKDTYKKRTNTMSSYREEGGTKRLEDDGEHSRVQSMCQCCEWNPSSNPTMPPVTDIYRPPTLRLGIDPEDVTKPDFSDIVTLDKDEHGQPQIKTIQGQIFPSQPNLPYETIQRCLFPKTGPKERICMPYEFKTIHVFDVPKKQQPLEGRKPVSEISFHLRQNLDSRLRTANKSTKRRP